MRDLNIKKVDDKPMVIHTKEKTKLHVKGTQETKIKGRNVLTVQKTPKISGSTEERGNAIKKSRPTISGVRLKTSGVKLNTSGAVLKIKGSESKAKIQTKEQGQNTMAASRRTDQQDIRETVRASVQKESGRYAGQRKAGAYQKAKLDREKAIGKKNSTAGTIASIGARDSLNQVEGGSEVYDSYLIARNLSRPVESASDAGRRLYRTQAAKAKEKRIKKVQSGKKISKKSVMFS